MVYFFFKYCLFVNLLSSYLLDIFVWYDRKKKSLSFLFAVSGSSQIFFNSHTCIIKKNKIMFFFGRESIKSQSFLRTKNKVSALTHTVPFYVIEPYLNDESGSSCTDSSTSWRRVGLKLLKVSTILSKSLWRNVLYSISIDCVSPKLKSATSTR